MSAQVNEGETLMSSCCNEKLERVPRQDGDGPFADLRCPLCRDTVAWVADAL